MKRRKFLQKYKWGDSDRCRKADNAVTMHEKWLQEHVDLRALKGPSQEIFVGCTSLGLDSYLPSEASHAQLWCNHKTLLMPSVPLVDSFSSEEPRVPAYSIWLVPWQPHEASSFIDEITDSLSLNVKWLIVMILTQHTVLFSHYSGFLRQRTYFIFLIIIFN